MASSNWNWSKFIPLPGSTITLGPVTVAHALVIKAAAAQPTSDLIFISYRVGVNPVSEAL
jgi:hypothetical protein